MKRQVYKEPTIEKIRISDLKPYENNPRDNDSAVDYVASSIRAFGFRVPLVIDKNNVIVCGHTRYKAAKKLRKKTVPCIRADDLTDDQIRAFRLVDNKSSELATWNGGKLNIELEKIEMDMSSFDFEIELPDPSETEEEPADDADDDEGYYGDERERTNRAYNLELIDRSSLTADYWQMPTIANDGFIPDEFIGFNYAMTSGNKKAGVHFYLDDYQFERVWNDPEKYVDVLAEYSCVLSPDFSLYMDMPRPMKIWNTYRSRLIGSFWQSRGLRVIPTVSWAEPETFEFCFSGIPEGSLVSISTIGVKRDAAALKVWHDGVDAMIEKIKPSAILIYGGRLKHDYKGIKTVYYDNKVTEQWQSLDKTREE